MIFQQYRGQLLVVRQPDHGVQTGLFARHWGNEQTPPFTSSERALVDEFLAEEALFQQSLAERVRGRTLHSHITTDPQVWYNYLLVQVRDRLSLQYAF